MQVIKWKNELVMDLQIEIKGLGKLGWIDWEY